MPRFLSLLSYLWTALAKVPPPLLLWIQYASCLTEDAVNANEIPDGTGQKPDCYAVMCLSRNKCKA